MSVFLYGTMVASSVGLSLATKAVTKVPNVVSSLANRSGISSYFTSTAKDSYEYYYKRISTEGVLYDTVLSILATHADKGYAVCQDPRHGNFKVDEPHDICADILCFRNTTTFYDYSAYGRVRVRVYYEDGKVVIMCQKKQQLDDFVHKFSDPHFDVNSLTFVGVG